MGSVKWTEEQQKAIYTRNCNLLVAAAAGSGKTAVLVERIINIVTDINNPVDIDKLLVVTFTNAAASEMRERIAKAIIEKLEKEPESSRLQRQLALLPKASITTLHSFCLEVIRNNFHMIGLNPDFRISDDTENILLKQETVEELFEKKYNQEDNKDFLKLVEVYCNNKEDIILQDMVLDLYNFSISFSRPDKWLLETAETFNLKGEDIKNSSFLKAYINNVKEQMENLEKHILTALKIAEDEGTLEPYKENLKEDLYMIQDLRKTCEVSWEEFVNDINKNDFKTLKRCKKDVNKDKQEKVKAIRDDVKKQFNSIRDEVVQLSYDSITEDFKNLYPIMKTLCKLVIEFREQFQHKKRDRGIIDFNDFEHMCLRILCEIHEDGNMYPSEVAKELRKKYEEIFIDEYQDTNSIQETIISLISRGNNWSNQEILEEPNVFMVGDIKQSIYKFRQAKPELFLHKYNNYSEEEESKYRKILLYKNFRSREEVINGINFIFEQIMSKRVGELDYNHKEALNLGADYKEKDESNCTVGGPIELHLIENSLESIENDFEEEDNPDAIQLEARMVCKRIKELVNSSDENFKVFDKEINDYRKATYKDIVILLRSTQKWAPIFMEELKENNIPVYADTGTGYFNTIEIKIMLSLLQVIDNPIQDIPLLSVMNSPIGAFTHEEIIDIKSVSKEDSYYEKMKDIVSMFREGEKESILEDMQENNVEEHLVNKIESFLSMLEIWRKKSIYMPLDEFIWYLYKTTGYYGYVGAMPGGEQRQANLKILFQRARQYEKTSYKGLFNFINFINKLKQSSTDLGSAKTIGENQNVVRIMSIHKSKGLEFPVVMVCGMGKKFNLMDINKKLLFHEDLGLGPECIDVEKRIAYPSLVKNVIRRKMKLEILSEEMRILYVALTRAKEKLIITGISKDIKKSVEKWSLSIENGVSKLSSYHMGNANNYLDWIGPCIMRNSEGQVLLAKGDLKDIEALKSLCSFKVKLWSRNELINLESSEEVVNASEDLSNKEFVLMEEEYKNINNLLSSRYIFQKSTEIPTVITVTELKRKFNENMIEDYSAHIFVPQLIKKPMFLQESKGLTASEKGTAMHSVMQRIDLNKVESFDEIKSQIENMVLKEFITEEEAKTINVNKIKNFFKSPLGERMKKSNKVRREVPFHIEINSTDIYKNLPKEVYGKEKLILQGIIDCYFEENDKIVLIDYKTDYVDDVEKIKDKYKIQIQYYASVLENITGMKVSEKYLYLFYNNNQVLI